MHGFPQTPEGFYQAHDLESGPDGDLFACGWFSDGLQFGSGPLPAWGNRDSYALHIKADGTIASGRSFGAVANDEFQGVCVDSMGRATYAGYFSAALDYGGGVRIPVVTGLPDVILVQFDAEDNHAWDRTFASPSNEFAFDVAPVGTTELRLLMVALGNIDVGGGMHTTGLTDIAVVAVEADDGSFLRESWTSGPGSTGGFYTKIAIAPDGGSSIITGLAGSEDFDPGPGEFQLTNAAGADMVLWRLNALGTW